jgi:anti-sigma regulatory factor (Ser/Thr protein kinase)
MLARPRSLKEIRDAARCWLAAVEAEPQVATDLLIAVGEACSNAVEHAYGPAGGVVTVYLDFQPPDVVAIIGDQGRWRPTRGKNRGRGTLIMREYADDLRIDHYPTGTKVVIRRRLAEAARR